MNILITAMGSATAISVARALTQDNHTVIGTDMSEIDDIAGGSFCSKMYTVPSAKFEKIWYITFLKDIIRKETIDLVIPCSDIEAGVLAENSLILNNIKATFNCVQKEAVKIANDKLETYKFFYNQDIPTPETMKGTYENTFKIDEPFIIKDRYGVGSKGFYSNLDQFYADNGKLDPLGVSWIIQEKLEGQEFTVDMLVLPHGLIAAVPRWRLEVRDGKSFKCKVFKDEQLYNWCKYIAFNLGLIGIYNIQGFFTEKNEWKFTEINCRPSATLVATTHAGINMPCLLASHVNGVKFITPIEDYKEVKILRFLYEVCWDENPSDKSAVIV